MSITAVAPSIGDGSSGSPYQIANINNLYWISQDSSRWDKCYIQTANIDASETVDLDSGDGWTPIGNSSIKFTGEYDGGFHIISNLFINRASSYQGLFGAITGSGCILKNIKLENVDISGDGMTGGLAGRALADSIIEKCCVSGSVVSTSNYVGGLVGSTYEAIKISCCYSLCDVEGPANIGGLVGINNDCSIENCYASGSVDAIASAGGLVGYNYSTAYVDKSYSSCVVSSTGSNVGGLIGLESGTTTNSFWDTNVSGQSTSGGGTGKTTAQMKTLATFTDTSTTGLTAAWDFVGDPNDDSNTDDIWNIDSSYPYIEDLGEPFLAQSPSGSGTSGDPYLISNFAELYWISQDSSRWDKYYKQTSDIDASYSSLLDSSAGWTPIGDETIAFTGEYDGDNYIISDLYFDRSMQKSGFFGVATNATFENINLRDIDLTTNSFYIGGIVGYAEDCIISKCSTTGSVTGGGSVGGIAGFFGKDIETPSISNSYSHCDVTGGTGGSYGGFVGFTSGVYTISNCYSAGNVTAGDTSWLGGFVGNNNMSAEDTVCLNCFWDTTTSGLSTSEGGTGKTTSEMQNIDTFTDETTTGLTTAWDFYGFYNDDEGTDYIWKIESGSYPEFQTWTPLSGAGHSSNPYQISTFDDLMLLEQQHDTTSDNTDYYILTNDIDASETSNWTIGWKPIGSRGFFTDNFNGQGYTISNLYINNTTYEGGLFGSLKGGDGNQGISNLRLTNISFTGDVVAGLANASFSPVENVYIEGSIEGSSRAAGFMTSLNGGCYKSIGINVDVSLSGTSSSDIAAGFSCYMATPVPIEISNCYYIGDINVDSSGDAEAIGFADVNSVDDISNCYSVANFIDEETYVFEKNSPTVSSDCFYCSDSTSGSSSIAVGKSSDEMKHIGLYTEQDGYNFLHLNYWETNQDAAMSSANWTSLKFSDDGFKVFLLNETNKKIYVRTLSTAYDLDTIGSETEFLDLSSMTLPKEFCFGPDASANPGRYLYVVDLTENTIEQWSLSADFGGTVTYDGSIDLDGYSSSSTSITINGLNLYIATTSSYLHRFTMNSQDIATDGLTDNDEAAYLYSFTGNTIYNITSCQIIPDGTKIIITDDSDDYIWVIRMNTANSLNSLTIESVLIVDDADIDNQPKSAFAIQEALFLIGTQYDTIYKMISPVNPGDNWDFVTVNETDGIWGINRYANNGYPYLRNAMVDTDYNIIDITNVQHAAEFISLELNVISVGTETVSGESYGIRRNDDFKINSSSYDADAFGTDLLGDMDSSNKIYIMKEDLTPGQSYIIRGYYRLYDTSSYEYVLSSPVIVNMDEGISIQGIFGINIEEEYSMNSEAHGSAIIESSNMFDTVLNDDFLIDGVFYHEEDSPEWKRHTMVIPGVFNIDEVIAFETSISSVFDFSDHMGYLYDETTSLNSVLDFYGESVVNIPISIDSFLEFSQVYGFNHSIVVDSVLNFTEENNILINSVLSYNQGVAYSLNNTINSLLNIDADNSGITLNSVFNYNEDIVSENNIVLNPVFYTDSFNIINISSVFSFSEIENFNIISSLNMGLADVIEKTINSVFSFDEEFNVIEKTINSVFSFDEEFNVILSSVFDCSESYGGEVYYNVTLSSILTTIEVYPLVYNLSAIAGSIFTFSESSGTGNINYIENSDTTISGILTFTEESSGLPEDYIENVIVSIDSVFSFTSEATEDYIENQSVSLSSIFDFTFEGTNDLSYNETITINSIFEYEEIRGYRKFAIYAYNDVLTAEDNLLIAYIRDHLNDISVSLEVLNYDEIGVAISHRIEQLMGFIIQQSSGAYPEQEYILEIAEDYNKSILSFNVFSSNYFGIGKEKDFEPNAEMFSKHIRIKENHYITPYIKNSLVKVYEDINNATHQTITITKETDTSRLADIATNYEIAIDKLDKIVHMSFAAFSNYTDNAKTILDNAIDYLFDLEEEMLCEADFICPVEAAVTSLIGTNEEFDLICPVSSEITPAFSYSQTIFAELYLLEDYANMHGIDVSTTFVFTEEESFDFICPVEVSIPDELYTTIDSVFYFTDTLGKISLSSGEEIGVILSQTQTDDESPDAPIITGGHLFGYSDIAFLVSYPAPLIYVLHGSFNIKADIDISVSVNFSAMEAAVDFSGVIEPLEYTINTIDVHEKYTEALVAYVLYRIFLERDLEDKAFIYKHRYEELMERNYKMINDSYDDSGPDNTRDWRY